MSYEVSYPYKTVGTIIVLYVLIFTFLDRSLEDKDSELNFSDNYPNLFVNQIFISEIFKSSIFLKKNKYYPR